MVRIKPSYWRGLTRHSADPSTSYDVSHLSWNLSWFAAGSNYADIYNFINSIDNVLN